MTSSNGGRVDVLLAVIAILVPTMVSSRSVEMTQDAPQINTTVGLISGLRADDGSSMYLGIPYAIVNESNPFGAPSTVHPQLGTFDAFNDTARCPQSMGVLTTSLDCLHLNIHVPETNSTTPLPVFVYIHGGRFVLGASGRQSLGPRFLIRHDVIFVSLNYRVSVYGFMCLNIPEVPGNQGLKDQLAALRWIKNNIAAFGGDENLITIAGDSAGGVSVDLQLLYAEEGLFHRAISQSGTALCPWATEAPNLNAAVQIANQMGFDTNDTSDAVSFLSNQTSTAVTIAVLQLDMWFQPCVEQSFPNVESFMTTHPVVTPLPNATIPLLAGYNQDEWLTVYAHLPEAQLIARDIFNVNVDLSFDFGNLHDEMKQFVRRFYAGDEPMTLALRRPVIDFDSDVRFVHPTQRTLAKYLDYNGTAYHYVFSYIGGRNIARIRSNVTEGGAAHSDELGYLFDLPDLTDPPTPEDQLMIDRITTLWTNFAKYGNPTPTNTTLLPVQWLPVTTDHLHYLNITIDLTLPTRPFQDRLSFWDFFYDVNREYVRGYSSVAAVPFDEL